MRSFHQDRPGAVGSATTRRSERGERGERRARDRAARAVAMLAKTSCAGECGECGPERRPGAQTPPIMTRPVHRRAYDGSASFAIAVTQTDGITVGRYVL